MVENFSLERHKLLRLLGAKLILTPATARAAGMSRVADRLAKNHGWFLCRQFENEANAEAHVAATAQKILDDFGPSGLDYWVTGFGTGGSLKGVGKRLQAENPEARIVVAEPDNMQLLPSDIRRPHRADGRASRSHPNSRAHPMQGWTPEFATRLAEVARKGGHIDLFRRVRRAVALKAARDLARQEGMLSGISGGAAVAAVLELAKSDPERNRILAMLPDTGERCLLTPLFEHVLDEITKDETAILTSADEIAPTTKASPSVALQISDEARAFFQAIIDATKAPVLMFGFEWREFCWAVRKLSAETVASLQSFDVNGPEYRDSDRGGDILCALFEIAGPLAFGLSAALLVGPFSRLIQRPRRP